APRRAADGCVHQRLRRRPERFVLALKPAQQRSTGAAPASGGIWALERGVPTLLGGYFCCMRAMSSAMRICFVGAGWRCCAGSRWPRASATARRLADSHLAHLNAFRFFGSGVRGDGPPYCVHMGYFPTRTDAEKWLQVLLPLYPKARIGELPPERPRNLTDTGVMRILEQRRTSDRRTGKEESGIRKIPLLAPEETATRRTLRDAVIRGLPVSFAVQLQLSETPIDLRTTAWDPI